MSIYSPYSIKTSIVFNFKQMYSEQNIVSDFPHLPPIAFLFKPFNSKKHTEKDDFKRGEGKKIVRFLFQGWAVTTFTPFETDALKRFEDFLMKKNIILDERWTQSWRLRFLLSTKLDFQKALEDMNRFMGYIHSVKQLHFTRTVSKILKEGLFYICGRDCHFRPILVFNVEKIVNMKASEEQLLEAQIYFFEYVIRNYLIPGQVENWISLIDSNYLGLFSFVDSMKKAFAFLADTYRTRLFYCCNVRITTSISIIWGIVKKFLDQETTEKINLFDQNVPENLLKMCNLSQIEQKFGGTMPNIPQGHFWPPRQWSNKYDNELCPVSMMSQEQYNQFYHTKTLHDTKIHEDNLTKVHIPEMRENEELQKLKSIQKVFKVELQSHCQDFLQYQKDIQPFSTMGKPIQFRTIGLKKS